MFVVKHSSNYLVIVSLSMNKHSYHLLINMTLCIHLIDIMGFEPIFTGDQSIF